MSPRPVHPSQEELREWALGLDSESLRPQLLAHLEACAWCAALAEAVPPDTLLLLLRRYGHAAALTARQEEVDPHGRNWLRREER